MSKILLKQFQLTWKCIKKIISKNILNPIILHYLNIILFNNNNYNNNNSLYINYTLIIIKDPQP